MGKPRKYWICIKSPCSADPGNIRNGESLTWGVVVVVVVEYDQCEVLSRGRRIYHCSFEVETRGNSDTRLCQYCELLSQTKEPPPLGAFVLCESATGLYCTLAPIQQGEERSVVNRQAAKVSPGGESWAIIPPSPS
jgi:hypothetical protein